jgi:hypothetical protein
MIFSPFKLKVPNDGALRSCLSVHREMNSVKSSDIFRYLFTCGCLSSRTEKDAAVYKKATRLIPLCALHWIKIQECIHIKNVDTQVTDWRCDGYLKNRLSLALVPCNH